MANGGRILAVELGISMSIVVWGASKRKYWPWPPNVNRVAFAYGVLGVLAVANAEFAALLGAGFLLAQIVKTPVDAEGNFKFTGGIPPGVDEDTQKTGKFLWNYLTWGSDPDRAQQETASKKVIPPSTGGSRGVYPITEKPPKVEDGAIPL